MSIPSRVRVKQRDITDCGAACLASIAAYYRLQMPVARIRQKAGTDKKGTNILGLIEAAEYLGFDARGVKGPFEALSTVPLPVIVHVVVKKTLHHYYVLYRVDKKTVTIMDPGQGRLIRMSHEAFKQEWTGVVVLLSPSQRFQKGNQKTSHGSRFGN
ncbi:MAG: cysteine peptidase family C39 domain-containing protein [Saprospiraceae bacterium]